MGTELQRLNEIVGGALELASPQEREAYVAKACAGDMGLLRKVQHLLEAQERVGNFLETPVVPSEPEAIGETPGMLIGRYKLLDEIGEGGFGTVFLAEQKEPVWRRVALKIVKAGMDTRQVIARFEAERQALALMDHPNIARVFDAGATDNGRPYFVMELVRGIPITQYCDEKQLSLIERLNLFAQVCHAVQHAHQKGIIHRDLKPTNILVKQSEGEPVPKIIDFGVAKALGQKLTEKTLFTFSEQLIGTPAYMSPEQAEVSRLDIDTRSDIYSLGVLLYELLTGKTPFESAELLAGGMEGMRRTIREQEPLRPSTRLGRMKTEELMQVAQHRHAEPSRLVNLARGDLDWIAIKCLEKDRTRRYATADELARDIGRYLTQEVVVARPPTTAYKVRKFVRRNKVVVSAGTLVAVALVLGILASSWQAVIARRAKQSEAEQLTAARQAQEKETEARRIAEQRLYHSLVGEARAKRLNRAVGYREEVFSLLRAALALNIPGRNLAELRQEAVGCLGDFVALTNLTWELSPEFSYIAYHPNGEIVAIFLTDGSLIVREVSSGKEISRSKIEPGEGVMGFSLGGERLVLLHMPKGTQSIQEVVRTAVIYVWGLSPQGRCSEPEKVVFPGVVRGRFSSKGRLRILSLDPPSGVLRLVDLDTRTVLHESKLSRHWRNWFARPVVDLSPDDRLIATESADSTDHTSEVDIWELQSGRLLHKVTPRLSICSTLYFSPDGKHLATASQSGLAIYDTESFERVAFTKEMIAVPGWVSFAPDAERSLIAINLFQQNQIRIWDYIRNLDFAVLNAAHESGAVSFSPDGKFLRTTGFQLPQISHYCLTVPEKLSLAGHPAIVPGIAFSPDGTRLASVGKDHTLKVWDTRKGTHEWGGQLPGQGQAISYSPDGRLLATSDYETQRVLIWDTRSRKVLLQLGTNAPGPVWSAQFSWDGRYLATAGDATAPEPGVTVWELVPSVPGQPQAGLDAKAVKSFPGQCLSLFFAPGGHRLEFINWVAYYPPLTNHMNLYSWNIQADNSPRLLTSDWKFPPRAAGSMRAGCLFSVTPDGKQLMFAETNGAIVTLDIATGRPVTSFPTATPGESREVAPEGEWTNARELRLSPDGTKLALTSRSTLGVDVWDPKNQQLLYSLPEQKSTVYCMAWSPDSRRLAISRASGDIEIWNLPEVERVLASLGLQPEQP